MLDLGCGPGSLAVRLLDRIPAAVAIDSDPLLLAQHVAALRAAGFTEIGIIWQHGEIRILAAVRNG